MTVPFQLALGNNTPTNVSTAQGRITMSGPQYFSLAGGTSGYVLTTDGAANLTWRSAPGAGGGIADAPSDSATYGRANALWVGVVPIGGTTMTGFLTLSAAPTAPLHAATKGYVDAHTAAITVDGTSITGNGIGTPLSVGVIDAGVY